MSKDSYDDIEELYADLLKDYPKETVKKDSVRILVK